MREASRAKLGHHSPQLIVVVFLFVRRPAEACALRRMQRVFACVRARAYVRVRVTASSCRFHAPCCTVSLPASATFAPEHTLEQNCVLEWPSARKLWRRRHEIRRRSVRRCVGVSARRSRRRRRTRHCRCRRQGTYVGRTPCCGSGRRRWRRRQPAAGGGAWPRHVAAFDAVAHGRASRVRRRADCHNTRHRIALSCVRVQVTALVRGLGVCGVANAAGAASSVRAHDTGATVDGERFKSHQPASR